MMRPAIKCPGRELDDDDDGQEGSLFLFLSSLSHPMTLRMKYVHRREEGRKRKQTGKTSVTGR